MGCLFVFFVVAVVAVAAAVVVSSLDSSQCLGLGQKGGMGVADVAVALFLAECWFVALQAVGVLPSAVVAVAAVLR